MTDLELLESEREDWFPPFEVHDLPSGDRIFYRDKDHSYWSEVQRKSNGWSGVKSARLKGVSTVAGTYSDSSGDALLNWAAKMDRIGVAEIASLGLGCDDVDDMRNALDWLRDAESIGAALEEAEATWMHIRNRAGTRGTNVHLHALHALAKGQATPDYEEMTEEERGYATGVVDWWLDRIPKTLLAEQVVADLELGVAGRLDLICVLRGEHVLVDAKTGNYVGAKDAVQQAGYTRLAEASGFPKPDWAMLLHLKADGTYKEVPVSATEEDFIAACRMYDRRRAINSEIRDAIKA